VEARLRGLADADNVVFVGGSDRGPFNMRPLAALCARLRAAGVEEWWLPRARPDRSELGNWIWSPYSPAQLVALVKDVMQASVDAYARVVGHWFGALGPRLQRFQLLPAAVDLTVDPGDPAAGHAGGPVALLLMDPLPRGSTTSVTVRLAAPGTTSESFWSAADRAERYAGCQELRPEAAEWLTPITTSFGLRREFQGDAVTTFVYEWLRDDLARTGWLR
jgi:hypothetical protein